jgi:hypothetical protein
MSLRKILVLAASLVAVSALLFLGLTRPRERRPFRFPNRITRSLPSHVATGPSQDDTQEHASWRPTTSAKLSDLHSWILETFRGKSNRQRLDSVFELGKTLGGEDLERALALQKRIPVEWMQRVLLAGIFASQGRLYGQACLDDLKDGIHSDLEDPFSKGGAFVGWASANPRAALAATKEGSDRGDAAALVCAAWASDDLDAMLAAANALPAGVTNFIQWAKADPERAVDFALTLDEALRPAVLDHIAHGWASNWSAPYRADFMTYLYTVAKGDSDRFFDTALAMWWAEFDPQQAVEHAASLDPSDGTRDESLRASFYVWAQADPDAAANWLKTYATQHADAGQLLLEAADGMAEGNPEAGARLLDATDDLGLGSETKSQVANKWVEMDPAAAFDWVAGKKRDRAELLQFAQTAGLNLARWNLAEALEWARQRSDAGLQASALTGVAFVAAYGDEQPDWILALPTGMDRDRCVAAYVTGALEHANGNAKPHENLLHQAPTNPSDLAKSVQESQLDDAAKQRLLGLIYGWPTLP